LDGSLDDQENEESQESPQGAIDGAFMEVPDLLDDIEDCDRRNLIMRALTLRACLWLREPLRAVWCINLDFRW